VFRNISLSDLQEVVTTMEQLAMHQPRDLINGNWGRVFSARTVEPEKLRCLIECLKRVGKRGNNESHVEAQDTN